MSDDEDEDDDNDAKISKLEEACEPQQHAAASADNHMLSSLDQEQEEEMDTMNSPAQQPWGAEVRAFPLLLCGLLACLLAAASKLRKGKEKQKTTLLGSSI